MSDAVGMEFVAFDALTRAGIPWVRLRKSAHEDHTPGAPAGDVDLLVGRGQQRALRDALTEVGFAEVRDHGRGSHRFFVAFNPGSGTWTRLDVVTRLDFGPDRHLRTELAASVLANAPMKAHTSSGISEPAPTDAFWLLFLHCALDKSGDAGMGHARWAELHELARHANQSGEVATLAKRLLPNGYDPLAACRSGHMEAFLAAVTAAAQQLPAQPTRRARTVRDRLARRLGGSVRWPGACLVILGPDGAGKTTLIDAMVRTSPFAVRSVYLGLPKEPSRLPAWIPGRWHLRRLGSILTATATTTAHRAAGRVVLCDRHPLDASAALTGPTRLGAITEQIAGLIAPRPNRFVVLDAPAEMMFARKGEHGIAALATMRQGYLDLYVGRDDVTVVPADGSVDDVARAVTTILWECLKSE